MDFVDEILGKLAEHIHQRHFHELETDGVEIKPVPPSNVEWKELYKSVNAFLNTRGGIVILGVKEVGSGALKRYELSGGLEFAEQKLKQIPTVFTDNKRACQTLSDCFPPMQIRNLLDGRVCIVYIDELAADRKFVYYDGVACGT